MIKNKKRTIIILITISIIIFLAFFVFLKNKNNALKENLSVPKTEIEKKYKDKITITLSLEEKDFNFPEKLPLLEIKNQTELDENFAKKIANNLGFPDNFSKINDPIDGKTYFWNNDKATLFVYTKTRKIKYDSKDKILSVNKQIQKEEIPILAKNFLIEKEILNEDSFKIGEVKFLKESNKIEGYEETNKESATLYQVNILPKESNYEIITTDYTTNSSYIQIRTDGTIYALQITFLPLLSKTTSEYKIKNYNEVKESLDEAVLIEMKNNSYHILSDLPANFFKNTEINKIELAYLMEPNKSTYLTPVFKLLGKTSTNDLEKENEVVFYLPAISKTVKF